MNKSVSLSDAWLHAGGNVLAVLIELYNWYMRYEVGAVVPAGLVMSLIVVLILLFTGWKGWEMVYRHRVGVSAEPSSRRSELARADGREDRDRSAIGVVGGIGDELIVGGQREALVDA